MKLRKLCSTVLTAVMVGSLLVACGSSDKAGSSAPENTETESTVEEVVESNEEEEASNESTEDVTITLEVGFTGDPLDAFRGVIDAFIAETGIQVDLVTPGSDYETVMKTRMASNDMPDVFITHGWSIARYKEYLTPLNSEAWFNNIEGSILPIISDDDGSIYVLPISQGINGLIYNKKVLEAAGVDPYAIKTMADFNAACESILRSGVTPLHIGAKDSWTTAGLLNVLAPAYFTSEGAMYPMGDALKGGSFDWDQYGSVVFEEIAGWLNNGYFNKDFVTADETATREALVDGNCAFILGGIDFINSAKTMNPDCELGVLPIPATVDGGKQEFLVGEGTCFGIWKDSKHMDQAKELLNYLAKADVAAQILEIDGQLPALSDVQVENQTYTKFKEAEVKFDGQLCYDNIFDREYLPSGMWSVMTDAVMEVFMEPSDTGVSAAVDLMKNNYNEKYEAK